MTQATIALTIDGNAYVSQVCQDCGKSFGAVVDQDLEIDKQTRLTADPYCFRCKVKQIKRGER
jgi:hypothetical protein